MQVVTFYTRSHEQMLDKFWLASLQHLMTRADRINPVAIRIDLDGGDCLTQDWVETLAVRSARIRELVDQLDEPFVCCDADSVFFRPFVEYIKNTLFLNKDKDILSMSDGAGKVQAGFMVIKPTDAVKQFYDELPDLTREQGNDQPVIQQACRSGRLKVGFVDERKFWYTAYVDRSVTWAGKEGTPESIFGDILDQIPCDEICYYHAARVIDNLNKLRMLKTVSDRVHEQCPREVSFKLEMK